MGLILSLGIINLLLHSGYYNGIAQYNYEISPKGVIVLAMGVSPSIRINFVSQP